MARQIHPTALAAALGLLGCPAPSLQQLTDSSPDPAPGATTGEDEPVPTGGVTSDVQTVTSAGETGPVPGDSSTDGTTTGEKKPGPPLLLDFFFSPKKLAEAGPAIATLVTTPAAVHYTVTYDGAIVDEGPTDDFAFAFVATSEKDNGPRTFVVTVDDGEDASESLPATVDVDLPEPGSVRCDYVELAPGNSRMTALARSGDALYAVGNFTNLYSNRLALWKIDARTCADLPGWPRLIGDWTAIPGLDLAVSEGVGVATDALGRVAVVGHIGTGAQRRPYVALFDHDILEWELPGSLGDEVHAVALTPAPYKTMLVAGATWDLDPQHRDVRVWHYAAQDSVVVTTLKSPFVPGEATDPDNSLDEVALAVFADPETDTLIVAGERDLETAPNLTFDRAFVLVFDPLGGRLATWTSSGDHLPHDGARALTRCPDGLRLGGWATADTPGAQPHPLTRWLDDLGASIDWRPQNLPSAKIEGVACDALGRTVAAATENLGLADPHARLFAFPDASSPLSWTADAGPGQLAAALAVDCDALGFCAWAGFLKGPKGTQAHLRVLNP